MRAAIGLFAVLLLIAGLVLQGHVDEAISGACFRVGLMMGVWWFAYPQVRHVPRWLAVTGGITMVLVILRPKLLFLAIPLAIVLWILRPRVSRRDSQRT